MNITIFGGLALLHSLVVHASHHSTCFDAGADIPVTVFKACKDAYEKLVDSLRLGDGAHCLLNNMKVAVYGGCRAEISSVMNYQIVPCSVIGKTFQKVYHNCIIDCGKAGWENYASEFGVLLDLAPVDNVTEERNIEIPRYRRILERIRGAIGVL
ncbi:hypothetical protein NEOLI_003417 [Neolecta irregularis DAH-3]|uniref:Uncharacterized protein n=1 Tax=Neolecta irregularis (strain DAH-3) TaxID=1198029 RepID=A0A1U7LN68_NEOID|nr:hypothetical protein NEOLI_003417 [Neolecta irregularis DAH-3]|eukprot:OLL23971.1 hypothetical protein NEOLI_003417 [Neolecta irregularis DAH-3]